MELLIALPNYADDIFAIIAKRDWLIHNFGMGDSLNLYNPANYLYNQKFDGVSYQAVFDLNIFQFLVSCTKKSKPNKDYRAAAALLVFCQMSHIKIEPCYAIYERLNYNAENLDEALTELQLFRSLDNGDMDKLAMYALGATDFIKTNIQTALHRNDLGQKLLQHQKLTEWDSLYLVVLAIIRAHIDKSVPASQKLVFFIDWIIKNFRLSLPGVMYAVRLFGKQPLGKMMKYKVGENGHQKRSAAFNMTWDLYLMSRFFKYWTEKDASCETIFVSDDKALQSVLRLSIDVQRAGGLEPIAQHLDSRVFASVHDLLQNSGSRVDRIYGTNRWSAEYRFTLISELEHKLFI